MAKCKRKFKLCAIRQPCRRRGRVFVILITLHCLAMGKQKTCSLCCSCTRVAVKVTGDRNGQRRKHSVASLSTPPPTTAAHPTTHTNTCYMHESVYACLADPQRDPCSWKSPSGQEGVWKRECLVSKPATSWGAANFYNFLASNKQSITPRYSADIKQFHLLYILIFPIFWKYRIPLKLSWQQYGGIYALYSINIISIVSITQFTHRKCSIFVYRNNNVLKLQLSINIEILVFLIQ